MVAVSEVTEFARRLADEFAPERIVLFGSLADGGADESSDADLLVVMPHEGKGWRAATAIRNRLRPGFALDLIVRSPEELRERLEMGDPFFREIVDKGLVLHEARDA